MARPPARHSVTCRACRGEALLKPEEVLPGRPRSSSASLKTSPLRWRGQPDPALAVAKPARKPRRRSAA